MRLLSYLQNGLTHAGVEHDGRVYAVSTLLANTGARTDCRTVRRLLEHGSELLLELEQAIRSRAAEKADVGAAEELTLTAPVDDPEKIICIGLNYRDHADEANLAVPPVPMMFAKFSNALTGPRDEIVIPRETVEIDYEAELAIVIGSRTRAVMPEDALRHVAGAMCMNDVSARDLQFETSQFTAGKTFDTFAPCGPTLVTLDEIADLQALSVRAYVNGDAVQDGSTGAMIFTVAELVSFVSQRMTLVPGDIISTGTPAGVGFIRDPPAYLRAGDVVTVEIAGLGRLENRIRDEE